MSSVVFIWNEDRDLSESQKDVLEICDFPVRIIESEPVENQLMNSIDVLIMDVHSRRPESFKFLDNVINATRRPGLLVTGDNGDVFGVQDRLSGDRARILLRPFPANAFIKSVNALITEALEVLPQPVKF